MPRAFLRSRMEGEDHGRSTHNGRADQDRFCRCLESIAAAVIFFEVMFGHVHTGFEPKLRLDFRLNVGNCFDERKLVDGLGVVRDRAIAVDGDRDGTHAEHTERHETESEDRRVVHEVG